MFKIHKGKTNVKEINDVVLIDSDNLVFKTLLDNINEQNMNFKIHGDLTLECLDDGNLTYFSFRAYGCRIVGSGKLSGYNKYTADKVLNLITETDNENWAFYIKNWESVEI